jgi:hypothetical protein
LLETEEYGHVEMHSMCPQIPFNDDEPATDSFGIYFICPRCGRRNKLINVGERGRVALLQTDDRLHVIPHVYP